MSKKVSVSLSVNAVNYEVLIEPRHTLLDVLRNSIGLTGSKKSCNIGACGCCTVLVDAKSVRSCLSLAVASAGKSITTIEGLSDGRTLSPIQQAFIDHQASQCGFCTSGMLLAAKALLDRNPHPSIDEIREGLGGNLCRCTGYVKIIDAVRAAAENQS